MSETAIVIAVHRGGCEAIHDDRVLTLRLMGRHAELELALAVGDEITFDPEREIVLEQQPRRTRLARQRRRGEQVIAANMDRLGIVCSVVRPPFRSGLVDRFQLAAFAGGLDPLLIVNKVDLLEGAPLPEEIEVYRAILPVLPVSARTGEGLDALGEAFADARTVLAGHSGVGKSSLVNALEPELRLETGELTGSDRGRHTTTRAIWMRLPGNAVVVDTPGVREIASGPVDVSLLDRVYPDIAELSGECRFRNCRHDQEPDCAVRSAIENKRLSAVRVASYARLIEELDSETREGKKG